MVYLLEVSLHPAHSQEEITQGHACQGTGIVGAVLEVACHTSQHR